MPVIAIVIVKIFAFVSVFVLVLVIVHHIEHFSMGHAGLAFVLILAIVIAIVVVTVCVFVLVLVQHLENLAMGRAGLPQTEQLTRVAVNLTFFGEFCKIFLRLCISRTSLQFLQHFAISNSSKARSDVKLMKVWVEGRNMHL